MYRLGVEEQDSSEEEQDSSEEEQDSSEEELYSDTSKWSENELCLLPVNQQNQSDEITRSQVSSQVLSQNKPRQSIQQTLTPLIHKRKAAKLQRENFYFYAIFGFPYSPDYNYQLAFDALSNADMLKKKENKELTPMDLKPNRKWSDLHRSKLKKCILDIETNRKLNIINQEVNNLQKILKQTKDPERKVEIRNKLSACNSLHEKTLKMTPKSLCPNLETEYDWVKISNDVMKHKFTSEECRAMWHSYLHPKINKTFWTSKESSNLKKLAEKHRCQDWDKVAMELGTKRTGLQCAVHYFGDKQTLCEGPWSKREDKMLKNVVKHLAVGSSIPWHTVATYLPGRTKKQIYTHWTYTLDPNIKKGTFTKEEDMLLVEAVQKKGKQFNKIAEMFPNRTSAQLYHRYTLMLEHPKQHAKWSPQDDTLLLQLVKKYGEGEWKKISDHFPSFNRVQVRQHYKVVKKSQLATSEEEYLTDEELEDSINEEHSTTASLGSHCDSVYAISLNADKAKRCKLKKMLLPNRKDTEEQVISSEDAFKRDCFSYLRFMQSYLHPQDMITQFENMEVERKSHFLSCVLRLLQAKLVIPEVNNSLLTHHQLSNTDRQIISFLRDSHLVTTTNVLSCEIRPVNEEELSVKDSQHISVLSEADSASSDLINFTLSPNYTILRAFQSLNSLHEIVKEETADDLMKYKGSALSSFEQQLFRFLFWVTTKIKPDFIGSESVAEVPKVRKRFQPSRSKKRKSPKQKREKDAGAPQRMKRKYVKSGIYKKEHTTEIRRKSPRIASTSVSKDHSSIITDKETKETPNDSPEE